MYTPHRRYPPVYKEYLFAPTACAGTSQARMRSLFCRSSWAVAGRRVGWIGGVAGTLSTAAALCEEKRATDDLVDKLKEYGKIDMEKFNVEDLGKSLYEMIEYGAPGKIGYGFMMGYSSGFCLKKVSKVAAFSLGGMFILIQTLSSQGYLVVNHEKIQQEVENILDVNKDGKIDSKDAEAAFVKLQEVLSYNIPTGGGFAAGLVMGLRS